MLTLGGFRAGTCDGVTRRAFLGAGASAAALPFLAGPAATPARAAAHARAKSVVFVWLWGAPSHLDTFDPKPDAPAEVRGPFAAIPTRTPGVRVTELLPRLADASHLYTLVRSHATSQSGHPEAGTVGLTGFHENPSPPQPCFGSVVARHRGGAGRLPPFMAVGRGVPRDVVRSVEGYGGGKFGRGLDPVMVACGDDGRVEVPSLNLLPELSPARVADRRSLVRQLDRAGRAADALAPHAAWDRNFEQVYKLLTDPAARAAFDLTAEADAVRASYGHTGFGQSCLLARRLVEAGVPYVQVNWSEYVEALTPNADFGWDTHIYNFDLLPDRHCPILDRALSALLHDLHGRGLLESTLVVAMGEFGRTPRINGRASRDHWPRCYSSLWAGAGVGGGRVLGASDRHASDPVTDPISPLTVGTTICELAGMDTQARAEMKVLDGGQVIREFVHA